MPQHALATAAYCGLQDSAPRAALLSLHARANDVAPDSWEHPDLVQIWFRGGADYVVPRKDVGVFTIGGSPRHPDTRKGLEMVADDVHRVLDGRTMHSREVLAALPQYERGWAIRAAAVTGRIHLRWDASSILLIGAERPDIDEEDARVELARRFVRWFGPVTRERFAWWAAIDPRDARATWKALGPELVAVTFLGQERFVHADDSDAAGDAKGVRLLPHGDPLIKIDPEIAQDDRRLEVFPNPKQKTSFWPVAGVVLRDGRFVGSWARQQRRVTVNMWDASQPEDVERAALELPIPGRGKPSVRFHLESER